MDAETIKLVLDMADRLTIVGFQLATIIWLIKKLELLESLIFTDWKRQRDNEHEEAEKAIIRKEITQSGL